MKTWIPAAVALLALTAGASAWAQSCASGGGATICLSATGTANDIQLAWTVTGTATGLQVMRDTDSNPSGRSKLAGVASTVRSYTDSTAVAGTPYWYWIKFSAGGSTYSSGAATATRLGSTAPAVTSAAAQTVNEGVTAAVYTATASVAAGKTATWSLGGADAARFSIDASSGALSFRNAPNYGAPTDADANNEYKLTLSVSDGTNTATAPLTVTVRPWNDGGAAGLPLPPGRTDIARPTGGATTNLRVLPWAGFTAAVSFTFDDSSPSHIEHWPTLKAQRVRSTFYLLPAANWYPGYDANFTDVAALGSELGNHTMHHCWASQLNGADLVNCPAGLASTGAEFDATTAYITSRLGQSGVWTAAYPFGDTGYRSAAATRFMVSRGVQPGRIAAGDATDAQNLPMVAHAGDPTVPGGEALPVFTADIDTMLSEQRWGIFLFHTILPTTNNWGGGEQIAVITGTMSYAKAKGNVWLDSVVNVGAYWLGQKLLQAAVTNTNPTSATTWTWSLPVGFPPGRKLRVMVDRGTLLQNGVPLPWNGRGYYELSLDARTLSWTP